MLLLVALFFPAGEQYASPPMAAMSLIGRCARQQSILSSAPGLAIVLPRSASRSIIYGARLSVLPIVGEETRWATGAREMLATGDWIVPRQQGYVFSERPPMTMWMMAAVGWLRG